MPAAWGCEDLQVTPREEALVMLTSTEPCDELQLRVTKHHFIRYCNSRHSRLATPQREAGTRYGVCLRSYSCRRKARRRLQGRPAFATTGLHWLAFAGVETQ